MIPFIEQTYYTLEEVMEASVTGFDDILHTAASSGFDGVVTNTTFYSTRPAWTATNSTDYPYLWEVFSRIRHQFNQPNTYFFISDTEYDLTDSTELDDLQSEAKYRVQDFMETLYETKDYYISLLKAQEDLKASLTAELEATTKTYFNDTPQTATTGYVDEDYTSTFNRTVSTIPVDVQTKLENVIRVMNNIYSAWVDEFMKFKIFSL